MSDPTADRISMLTSGANEITLIEMQGTPTHRADENRFDRAESFYDVRGFGGCSWLCHHRQGIRSIEGHATEDRLSDFVPFFQYTAVLRSAVGPRTGLCCGIQIKGRFSPSLPYVNESVPMQAFHGVPHYSTRHAESPCPSGSLARLSRCWVRCSATPRWRIHRVRGSVGLC